ncbi:MAG: hypothetical protein CMJ87_10340 [Planctomycetes bacterium]|nr:hypothetical protein [Planctomycetota bacterium]
MKHIYILLLGALLTGQAAGQQDPIRLTFDVHVDPAPNSLSMPAKIDLYEERTENMAWVLDQTEPLNIPISFLSTGWYMEFLQGAGAAGPGAVVLRRLYDSGGQIGSHSHAEYRRGPFDWPSISGANPPLSDCRQSWQDNVDWVNNGIMAAYSGSPPDSLAVINNCKGSHLPKNEPDYHTLMAEFGITVREPGPEEDYYGTFGHHIWHAYRPATHNYMAEDLSAPFVQVTAGPVIGEVGVHHGIHQDMSLGSMQNQLLQLYFNWRFADRSGAPPKVWTWGWGSHAHNYDPSSVSRETLSALLPWIETHLRGRIEASGSTALVYDTHQGVAAVYEAWEAANPGTSSFSFDTLTQDWNEYPFLRPVAEEMLGMSVQADLSLGGGLSAFLHSDGTDNAVSIWGTATSTTVDLSAHLGSAVRVVGLETGIVYAVNNPAAVEVLDEPLFVTERGASCSSAANYCATTPNSTGHYATISHHGSTSVSANDLVLTAADAVPGQFGIFFYGSHATQVTFGNGFRCVDLPIQRLSVTSIDAAGDASHALDNTTPPSASGQITPGTDWHFQFWFRDPPAGGSYYNLSDGLTVPFCP